MFLLLSLWGVVPLVVFAEATVLVFSAAFSAFAGSDQSDASMSAFVMVFPVIGENHTSGVSLHLYGLAGFGMIATAAHGAEPFLCVVGMCHAGPRYRQSATCVDRNVLSFRGMLSQVLGQAKVARLNPGFGLLSPGTRCSRRSGARIMDRLAAGWSFCRVATEVLVSKSTVHRVSRGSRTFLGPGEDA